MKMLERCFVVFTLLHASYAVADCEPETIGAQIAASDALYRFEQLKTVEYLSNPLRSSGLIWLAPGGELVWQVQAPVRSTTVISGDRITEFNRRDERQPGIDIALAHEISGLFLKLLAGDFAALEDSFDQSLDCSENRWQLRLTPVQSDMAALFDYLLLAGAESIERIEYGERRGDLTEIDMRRIADPAALTADLDGFLNAPDNAPP